MFILELYLEILTEKDGGRGPSYMALPNEKMVLGFSHWLGQGKKFGNSLNRITETPKEENSEFSLLTWTFTINKGKK